MRFHGKQFINADMVLKKGDRITIDIPLYPRPQNRTKEQYDGCTITVAFPVSGPKRGNVVCCTEHIPGQGLEFIDWEWMDICGWEPLESKVPKLKEKTLPQI